MAIKIEDIIFWLLILAVIALAIWKLVGSPTDTAALIAIALFLVSAIVDTRKKVHYMDKKTEAGFVKIKKDLEIIKIKIDHKFDNMDNRFNDINKRLNGLEALIKRK